LEIITIEIEEYVHDLIVDLKGLYGDSGGAIINYIVKQFYSKNYKTIQKLRAIKNNKQNQKTDIEKKLKDFLEVSEEINIDVLRKFLGIDDNFFNSQLISWAKKYNLRIDNDKIVKVDMR
jgi:hypothetical protein